MKPLRLNKAIGLALGERSALVAEVAAGGADRPAVRAVGEFAYPDGVTIQHPAELGAALGAFLRDQKFAARSAVVGLPARWLVVKPKDVPPADPATLADLLRLSAESEFSSELRDLVYDYAADATAGHPSSVLLLATPQKYLTAAAAVCDAAKINAVAVTPSAVALGAATAAPVVLSVGGGGAELTAQSGRSPTALRHLRGPGDGDDPKPFQGELRRAVSTLPGGANGQMVAWGGPALNGSLGLDVTAGDWATLGVTAEGIDRRFAPAVALALSVVGDGRPAVDFLHPRLAPPKPRRVPRWAVWATVAAVAAVAAGAWAYVDLQRRQAVLTHLQAQLDRNHDPGGGGDGVRRQGVVRPGVARRKPPVFSLPARPDHGHPPGRGDVRHVADVARAAPADRGGGGGRAQDDRGDAPGRPAGGQDVGRDPGPAGGRPGEGRADVHQRQAGRDAGQRAGRGRVVLGHVRVRADQAPGGDGRRHRRAGRGRCRH